LSGVRPHVAADLVEQRGLAGAIRADDQPTFAWPYRQRHVVRDRKPAETLVQVDDLECMRGHREPLRSPASNLDRPGTMPVGMTRRMNRKPRPSSMSHRSR